MAEIVYDSREDVNFVGMAKNAIEIKREELRGLHKRILLIQEEHLDWGHLVGGGYDSEDYAQETNIGGRKYE
ncbi:MAG: hypothetical protein PVJ67_01105 [Candidatus Pacearchaeota archaeon]|jgi:hypothetical protein